MNKREASARTAELGARAVDDVTKAVDLLVMGAVNPRQFAPGATKTSKLAKAERYRAQGSDIEIIDAEQFLERLSIAEG